MAGIVHFARFFIFMETAEHEFLRSLGTSVSTTVDGNQIGWPRLQASCEYLKPLRFEEEVEIQMAVFRKGKKSITYDFEFRRSQDLIARGQITAACCVCNPGEPIRAIAIPDHVAGQIEGASESRAEGLSNSPKSSL